MDIKLIIYLVLSTVLILTGKCDDNKLSEPEVSLPGIDFKRLQSLFESSDEHCHAMAVWNCGHSIIRTFKFLDYLPKDVALRLKCASKNAFFSCLVKIKSRDWCPTKHRLSINRDEKFKKRLISALWSTSKCHLLPYLTIKHSTQSYA